MSDISEEKYANQMAVQVSTLSVENLSNSELLSATNWLLDQDEPINKATFRHIIKVMANRLESEITNNREIDKL